MPSAILNSIVIVNYNNKKALWGMLGSLKLEQAPATEVIVVDSASTDGSVEMVKKEFRHVRLIVRAHNRGFASAIVRGIDKVNGSVIIVCHSDLVTDVHVLGELADRVRERNTAGARVVAAVPRLVGPDDTDQPSIGKLPGLARGVVGVFNPVLARKCEVPTLDHVADHEWTPLVCMALDTEMLARLGSIDERFFLYWADADLCKRIHEKGFRIAIRRDLRVVHAGHSPNEPLPDPLMKIMRQDLQHYFEKHSPSWQHKMLTVDEKLAKFIRRESA
jgi:GT2 family glycosyltransferase